MKPSHLENAELREVAIWLTPKQQISYFAVQYKGKKGKEEENQNN